VTSRNVLIAHELLATGDVLPCELVPVLQERRELLNSAASVKPHFVRFSAVICYIFNMKTTRLSFSSLRTRSTSFGGRPLSQWRGDQTI